MTDETEYRPTDEAQTHDAYDPVFANELRKLGGGWYILPTSVDGDVLVYGLTDRTTEITDASEALGPETRIQVSHTPDDGSWEVARFDGRRVVTGFYRDEVVTRRAFDTDGRETALDMVTLLLDRYAREQDTEADQ